MPAAGPRGPAGGTTLSTSPATPQPRADAVGTPPFRCAAAALERGDALSGSATHVAAFLVVEHHGPWGTAVLRDSRLDPDVRRHLSVTGAVRVLLARRHHRAHRGSTYAVFVCFPHEQRLLRHEVGDHRELLDLDVAALARGDAPAGWQPEPGPLYGVCTHGRHDACCAERGRPVAAALTAARPEQTWEVSHVGGDRFAANLLVLPEGLCYGQVTADEAPALAQRHDDGRLDLDRLRGRASRPMHVQHAEIALRRHLGEDRRDAVRVVRRDGAVTVFAHGADTWSVGVERRLTDVEGQLTCGAAGVGRVPVFEVVSLERV